MDIQEKFIGILDVSGSTTGEDLSEIIEGKIKDLGLSMDYLREQCYDGAGLYQILFLSYHTPTFTSY